MNENEQTTNMTNDGGHEPGGLIRLGGWSLYFLLKIAAYWKGLLQFHPLANLSFAAFLLMPIASRRGRWLRFAIAVPAALALVYYDSWLPSTKILMNQIVMVMHFSDSYLFELLQRIVTPERVMVFVLALALYRILSRYVRLGVIVVALLIVVSVRHSGLLEMTPAVRAGDSHAVQMASMQTSSVPAASAQAASTQAASAQPQAASAPMTQRGIDTALAGFYATESKRRVSFPSLKAGTPPFDIVFLHICSLAWDDIRAVDLQNNPFWKRFDILFTHFNGAATYSGPAAIRLLRGACGEESHLALYAKAAAGCYVMHDLERSGFRPSFALNHNGVYGGFLDELRQYGGLGTVPLMSQQGLPLYEHAFDGSPVRDDFDVLHRWLRHQKGAPSTALYYDTISLHDGNHVIGQRGNYPGVTNFKPRLRRLTRDIGKFMDAIKRSGRRTIVVFVPEHGFDYRGDEMQLPGMREIPSPRITILPVGIKVLGPHISDNEAQVVIRKRSSYQALMDIVSRMVGRPPFASATYSASAYTHDLPTIPYVAENSGYILMRLHGHYYMRLGQKGDWANYNANKGSVSTLR